MAIVLVSLAAGVLVVAALTFVVPPVESRTSPIGDAPIELLFIEDRRAIERNQGRGCTPENEHQAWRGCEPEFIRREPTVRPPTSQSPGWRFVLTLPTTTALIVGSLVAVVAYVVQVGLILSFRALRR